MCAGQSYAVHAVVQVVERLDMCSVLLLVTLWLWQHAHNWLHHWCLGAEYPAAPHTSLVLGASFAIAQLSSYTLPALQWERPCSGWGFSAHFGSLQLASWCLFFVHLGDLQLGIRCLLFVHLGGFAVGAASSFTSCQLGGGNRLRARLQSCSLQLHGSLFIPSSTKLEYALG